MYFSQIRAGLISTVLLLSTALASPALAETLPEISPRQIASDVDVVQNPQTGVQEFIAPSFDPFEEDRTMAGNVSLRSAGQATTIDGQAVRGGALLDLAFYYNSVSNDPYDTRGYEEVVYLSGEYAPVTYRDNRILECNEHVQDVVYYHEDYYRPSLYGGLYRPYPFYTGHFGFSSGYGYNYGFNRGFGLSSGFIGGRSFGNTNIRNRRNIRNRQNTRRNTRGGIANRLVDGVRRTNAQREDRSGIREERRANRNRNSDSRETRRSNRSERRNERAAATRASTPRQDRAPRAQNNRIRNNNGVSTSARRSSPRATTTRQATTPRTAAPTSRPQQANSTAPARRARNTERSRPARAERARSRSSQRQKSQNSPRRNGGNKGRSRGNSKLKLMSFLPMASAWSRNVVRNVDIQCAREEILSVHIPQDRLDAARFDGLTVLVLDRAGHELPVFVPPNYIEGFRQAVSGRAAPNVSYQEPRSYGIEETPCPAGTIKQSDGTCLQGGATTYGGYPTR